MPPGTPARPRRRRLPWLLLAAFVLVPIVEIYVLIQVGQVIGGWWTVALLILDSVIGGWLVKREGGRAWRALREALAVGRMPATELSDGALILIGGTLMLTPGFVTDALGILLILPVTRPVLRRLLAGVISQRLSVNGPVPGAGAGPTWENDPRPGPVVRGEVVED